MVAGASATEPMTLTKLTSICGIFSADSAGALQCEYKDGSKCTLQGVTVQRETREGNNLAPLIKIALKVKAEENPEKILWYHEGKNFCFDVSENIARNRITCEKVMPDINFNLFEIKEVDDLKNVSQESSSHRYALLITNSYKGDKSPLPGTEDDGRRMHAYLQKKGFQIIWMQDFDKQESDPLFPNCKNMKRQILKFAQGRTAGDVLWFHYSGHGTQISGEKSGDEADGKDEAMVPCKWDRSIDGLVSDDWLYDHFVCQIPPDVETNVVFDCCHSGSAMDLPYSFDLNENKFTKNNYPGQAVERAFTFGAAGKAPPSGQRIVRDGVKILYISGCADTETSKEVSWKKDGKIIKRGGTLTLALLETFSKNGDKITLGELAKHLFEAGKEQKQAPCISCTIQVPASTKFANVIDGKSGGLFSW